MTVAQHFFSAGSGATLVRTLITFALIWGTGRTLVQVCQTRQCRFSYPNMMAITGGAVTATLLTGFNIAVGTFSFRSMIWSLFVVLAGGALLALHRYRRGARVSTQGMWLLPAYVGATAALYLLLPPSSYPLLKSTTMYLSQGFNLFLPDVPGELPFYGAKIAAPLAYQNLPIEAVFGLLSYADPLGFYIHGEYWINILLAPAIPIGAFLVSKRFFPWWAALVLSAAFCWITLDAKIWSLRGEALGWLIGFPMLLAFFDILDWIDAGLPIRRFWPAPVFLGLSYVTLIQTHGLVTVLVGLLCAGLAGLHLLRWKLSRQMIHAVCAFGLFALVAAGFMGGLVETMGSSGSVIEKDNGRPAAGTNDAATEYDNVYDMLPSNAPNRIVQAHPPYADPFKFAVSTAILPLTAIFRPGFDRIGLLDFPGLGMERVRSLPTWEMGIYFGLPLVLFLIGRRSAGGPMTRARLELFSLMLLIILLIVLLAVYLDLQSVSLYPVASIRRAHPYVRAFYLTAIVAGSFDWAMVGVAWMARVALQVERQFGEALDALKPAVPRGRASLRRSRASVMTALRSTPRTTGAAGRRVGRAADILSLVAFALGQALIAVGRKQTKAINPWIRHIAPRVGARMADVTLRVDRRFSEALDVLKPAVPRGRASLRQSGRSIRIALRSTLRTIVEAARRVGRAADLLRLVALALGQALIAVCRTETKAILRSVRSTTPRFNRVPLPRRPAAAPRSLAAPRSIQEKRGARALLLPLVSVFRTLRTLLFDPSIRRPVVMIVLVCAGLSVVIGNPIRREALTLVLRGTTLDHPATLAWNDGNGWNSDARKTISLYPSSANPARMHHVVIATNGARNPLGKGAEAWIKAIRVDRDGNWTSINLSKVALSGTFVDRDGTKVLENTGGSLSFSAVFDRIEIATLRHPWSGIVTITIDDATRSEDLFDPVGKAAEIKITVGTVEEGLPYEEEIPLPALPLKALRLSDDQGRALGLTSIALRRSIHGRRSAMPSASETPAGRTLDTLSVDPSSSTIDFVKPSLATTALSKWRVACQAAVAVLLVLLLGIIGGNPAAFARLETAAEASGAGSQEAASGDTTDRPQEDPTPRERGRRTG